jgi:succinate-acetate transporter protein
MDLPGPDRRAVSEAVLVRGNAVLDPRLAPAAVDLGKWFDFRISIAMVLWGAITVFCFVAALTLHLTLMWIMAAFGILFSLLMAIPKWRYRRAIRENTSIIEG